jgi:hypothetical protein
MISGDSASPANIHLYREGSAMTVEFRINSDEGIVYGTVSGDVDADEIMDGLDEVINGEEYEPGFSGITDLRHIRWESDQGDLRRLVQFLIRNRSRLKPHRSAVVVSGDRTYGMTRMFEVFSEQTPIKLRVFRDYDRALSWVRGMDEKG